MPRKILISTTNSIGTFITKVNTLSDYFGDMDDLSTKFDSLGRDSNLVSAINLLDSQIGDLALLNANFRDSDRYSIVNALNSIVDGSGAVNADSGRFNTIHAGLDSAGQLDLFRESGGKFELGGWSITGTPNVDSVSYIENLYTENFYTDSMRVGQYLDIYTDDSGNSVLDAKSPSGAIALKSNGQDILTADSDGVVINGQLSLPNPSILGLVQDIVDSGFVTQGEFINAVFHSGNGTVIVPDSGYAKGAQITIRTVGTMTIQWGDSADAGKGISLGNSTKLASGIFDGTDWYFSETVV